MNQHRKLLLVGEKITAKAQAAACTNTFDAEHGTQLYDAIVKRTRAMIENFKPAESLTVADFKAHPM